MNTSRAHNSTDSQEGCGWQPCGWFDSSQDLREGLNVTVHDAPERVVSLLPLTWWVSWELARAAPAVSAAYDPSREAGA